MTIGNQRIKYKDIPDYLQAGEFYRNLDDSDSESVVEVPNDSFQLDGSNAANLAEFSQLLKSTLFWMLDEIPPGILQFCSQNESGVWLNELKSVPTANESGITSALLTAFCDPKNTNFAEVIRTGRWELMVCTASRLRKSGLATIFAAKEGHLNLLVHLHENGFHWHKKCCSAASEGGHLDCLQYAHEHGCAWDHKVYKWAAQNGHLHCMEYANKHGLGWHAAVCKHAALSGQLACLRYAYLNGCPWNIDTTSSAAAEGHVQCLQFALHHGCPHDISASHSACKFGRSECLRTLVEYGGGVRCYDQRCGCFVRRYGVFIVSARKQLSLGRRDTKTGRDVWQNSRAAVRAGGRMRVGRYGAAVRRLQWKLGMCEVSG